MESPLQYPSGNVRRLLESANVSAQTRAALTERLVPAPQELRFFDQKESVTIRAAVTRLIADNGELARYVVAQIDARLAANTSDGWRYDVLPSDPDAYRQGLRELDELAQEQQGVAFAELEAVAQEAVLTAAFKTDAPGAGFPLAHFMEDLLADCVTYLYSHPQVLDEIGYAGFADVPRWSKVGLNQTEARETLPAGDARTKIPDQTTSDPQPTDTLDHLPPMRTYATSDVVDAVVIGMGAGGAPLLARLAAAGLRVVALEAGQFWQPQTDFVTDEVAQQKLYWADERLSAGDDPIGFGANNSGVGVGGSTLHYTAYTPRAHADDLQLYSEFGVGADWPLSYDDLAPYYAELETFLGISGPKPYLWGDPQRAYPLPPLSLNAAAQLMQKGCAPLGIRTSPAANAALSAPYYREGLGWRAACTNRGFCQAGCSVGAKASMDVTYIPVALRAGAEVRAQSFVTGFERDPQGRISAVIYQRDRREERQKCAAVFLCGGAIETPRLLLLHNLANDSGQVGRNFMAHVGVQVWAQFDDDTRPYKGIPGGLISEDTHRPADADFAGGYLLQSIGVMPVTYVQQFARGTGTRGTALRDHMRGYNHVAGINVLGDCLPSDHNFLEISDEKDARGLPKPRIHFTAGDNEKRMQAHAERLMRQIWDNAGGHETWVFPRFAHIIGTCRMGDDPARSVVNAEGRSHDIPNLYISDNSTFPSALSVNPALTIMALSLRTADSFIRRRKNGDV